MGVTNPVQVTMGLLNTRANASAKAFGFTADQVINPASLNPKAWWDASDTSTITASGGKVSQWNNKGSLGNLTQATGALQPTTGSTTKNSLNVLDFDGGDVLGNPTNADWKFLNDGTNYIVACAWKPGVTANPGSQMTLIHTASSSGTVGTLVWWDDQNVNETMKHNVYGSGATPVSNFTGQAYMAANTWCVYTLLADPDNGTAAERSAHYLNAGTAVKNNTQTTAVSNANPTNPLEVGALSAVVFFLHGSLAELIIVDGANATDSNREKLRNYLNKKWAIY